MSEETIYKAQERALMNQDSSKTAVILIGGGLGLLALTLSGVNMLGLFAPFIFVGGLGALLLWPSYRSTSEHPPRAPWLAGPGMMFLATGGLITFTMLINRPEMMAYAWALLPISLFSGLMYGNRFNQEHPIHTNGPKVIRVLGWIMVGMGLFFELLVFETFGPWWPIGLVGYGIFLLLKQRNTSKENAI